MNVMAFMPVGPGNTSNTRVFLTNIEWNFPACFIWKLPDIHEIFLTNRVWQFANDTSSQFTKKFCFTFCLGLQCVPWTQNVKISSIWEPLNYKSFAKPFWNLKEREEYQTTLIQVWDCFETFWHYEFKICEYKEHFGNVS